MFWFFAWGSWDMSRGKWWVQVRETSVTHTWDLGLKMAPQKKCSWGRLSWKAAVASESLVTKHTMKPSWWGWQENGSINPPHPRAPHHWMDTHSEFIHRLTWAKTAWPGGSELALGKWEMPVTETTSQSSWFWLPISLAIQEGEVGGQRPDAYKNHFYSLQESYIYASW